MWDVTERACQVDKGNCGVDKHQAPRSHCVECPRCTTHLPTYTHLRLQSSVLLLSFFAATGQIGLCRERQLHSARGKPAHRGRAREILIVHIGGVQCKRLSIIIFRQIAAGLHRGGPSLVREDPNTTRAAFTCVELVHESRDPTPSLQQALFHTSLPLVHGAASARSLPGETSKPFFIKDRAALSMELIADAQSLQDCV